MAATEGRGWEVEIQMEVATRPAAGESNLAAVIQKEAEKVSSTAGSKRWEKHSIYLVPDCIKQLNPQAYTPQVVSFGPYHHGAGPLAAMEPHKLRSVTRILRRSKKAFHLFVAAVREVQQCLMDAYEHLDERWTADPEVFLKMMIVDGCFMLEVLRMATARSPREAAAAQYAHNDPIFSAHGMIYTVPYIKRDMLMLENQLPLLVLLRLFSAESGKDPQTEAISVNNLVHKFFAPNEDDLPKPDLGLHPLDICRMGLLKKPGAKSGGGEASDGGGGGLEADGGGGGFEADGGGGGETEMIWSATELNEAGVRFHRIRSRSLLDIRFRGGVLRGGVLSLPEVVVDDLMEPMFRNLMAMERLHVGAGNEVTSYVFFMDRIIDSARDVGLLQSHGIIQNAVGSDKAVAQLFNSLSKDVSLDPEGSLDEVHQRVNAYCRKRYNIWRANLMHTYFRNPWAFLSLAAAIVLLVLTVVQTIFTILQWHQGLATEAQPPSSSVAPSSN